MNYHILNIVTYIYGFDTPLFISDHTKDTAPVSHQLTEVKLLQALAVLWWGTTWEGKVMTTHRFFPFFLSSRMQMDKGQKVSETRGRTWVSGWLASQDKKKTQLKVRCADHC